MRKIGVGFFVGLIGLGLLSFGGEWVREAWAQARTVLYKDFQQTVSTSHIFSPSVAATPPFTVIGNGVGIPASGLAPDIVGSSTVVGLGAATTVGKTRRLSDGGAIGAVALADGTNWRCGEEKSQKMAIVTCPPYNAKGDGVTDDSAALIAAIGEGNKTVLIPPGTFIATGLIFKSGLTIRGAGVGATILKLPNAVVAQAMFASFEVTPLTDVEVGHLTIDGNGANQVVPSFAVLGTNGIQRLWLHNLYIKDSVEYCIGMEGGTHTDVKISDLVIENCRRDGIDIKNEDNASQRIEITNVSVSNPGATLGPNPGLAGSVCFDQGGSVRLSNISCVGLTGNSTGVNFRRHQVTGTGCEVAFCEGGEASSLTNFYISGDGVSLTSVGVRLRDAFIQVSNGHIKNVAIGVHIESDGIGDARQATVSNVAVLNSKGLGGFVVEAAGQFSSITNCVSQGNDGSGFYVNTRDVRLLGNIAGASIANGIFLTSEADYTKVIGNTILASTGSGILVSAETTNVAIIGNNSTTNLRYGIELVALASSVVITGNSFVSNTLGAVLDNGTLTRIQGNSGVTTANSGGATINSGTTSAVVTHGLSFTPFTADTTVTLAEDPTNTVGAVWVDTITSTQFTVRVENDPGASNLTFGWRALVKQ